MASENESKKIYCLQVYEDFSTWKAPLISLAFKQFNIRTVLDCRPNPQSKNRVFNKKMVRRLAKNCNISFEYSKRLASGTITEELLNGSFANLNFPVLVLSVGDQFGTKTLEVCNALHDQGGHRMETISIDGMKVTSEGFVSFVLATEEAQEEEVEALVEEKPRHNLHGKRTRVDGDQTIGMGRDGTGIIHSAGLIVTRKGKNGDEVLAIIRGTNIMHELAKGRVEKKETFAQCALREVEEETGCTNPHVLEVEWRFAYVRQYPYNRPKKGIHTKKVFWFYAKLPEGVALEFGPREEKTRVVEWICPNTVNKSLDIPDALLCMKFADHSIPMGFVNEKGIQCRKPPRFSCDDPESYLTFLEEHGFVVIADVLNSEEIEEGKEMFWEWMEGLGSGIDRNDPNTWTNKNWPAKSRFRTGVVHTCGVGQSDLLWFCRSRPSVRQVFEQIWETNELLTSYDGFAVWRPWHYNKVIEQEWKTSPSWFHVDQNPATNPGLECYQAQVTFTPSTHMTGGFTCIPGSHKVFPEFQEPFKLCGTKIWRLTFKGIRKHRVQNMDKIHVCCEAGDMIIWDSRTMHASTHAFVKPETDPFDLLRLTSFVCFTPGDHKSVTEDLLGKRSAAPDGYITTSHLPYEWHPTENLETSNQERANKNLKKMKMPKRKRDIPEEAYPLISGYGPV